MNFRIITAGVVGVSTRAEDQISDAWISNQYDNCQTEIQDHIITSPLEFSGFLLVALPCRCRQFQRGKFWWFFSLERFQSGPWNSYSNSPVVMNVLLTSINLRIMIAVSESMGACFLLRGNDPLKTTGEGWLVMLPHQCSLEDILESKIPNLENHPFFWGGELPRINLGGVAFDFLYGEKDHPWQKKHEKFLGDTPFCWGWLIMKN